MSEQDIQKIISDNTALHSKNTALETENTALHTEVSVLKEELAQAAEQLAWLKKQVFGRKTEQISAVMEGMEQTSLFEEKKECSVTGTEETVTIPEHTRKRRKKRTHDDWMSSLPVEEIIHEEENPVCEKCGAVMEEIGKEKVYDELVYTPAEFHVRRHIAKVYKCPECGNDPDNDAKHEDDIEGSTIRKAEYPEPMISGSYCSPELLAHIVYEKYGKGVPLHRQEKDFSSKGIPLLKATISNWVSIAAVHWCMPIAEKMAELLLSGQVIHADETRIQVLHEEGRKATSESKMWVYCNGKMNDRSIVIFDYKPTRKGENAKNFLNGFSGYLVRDGYSGYNAVTGVKHCGCWTHTRRYFVNAMPSDKSLLKTSIAANGVEFCNKIYHEEGLLKELTAEERYKQRLLKVKPLIDAFFVWLESLNISGKTKLADAVRYALNEKPYLYTFLEDGNVPIDNNRAENAIRPFTIGRKNWLFSNTANGAECSAILYSIVSTAQANRLDTELYLTQLFYQPAGTIILPWNQ